MALVAKMRALKYHNRIEDRETAYSSEHSIGSRSRIQLELWNVEWVRIISKVPFYREIVRAKKLPRVFETWEQFVSLVPIMDRSFVQEHCKSLSCVGKSPDYYRFTGGSTAQPVQIPAWEGEKEFGNADMWLGRSWYGIHPSSRLFLLWGHSHIHGQGVKRYLRKAHRNILDYLLGYTRFSAYDLSLTRLNIAVDGLLKSKPDYLIGYSSALDMLARADTKRSDELAGLGLKAVIATAESFPRADSEECLRKVFCCPIAMEYGSGETGLIAHTVPLGGYRVFWRSFFVEAISVPEGGYNILVTSLYPRCFPLVRYQLGDRIELSDGNSQFFGLAEFKKVIGRRNEHILLADGAEVHSELFTHVVRSREEIRGFQIVQSSGKVSLHYLAARELTHSETHDIREDLGRVHPLLGTIDIIRVATLRQTAAGKMRMVVSDG